MAAPVVSDFGDESHDPGATGLTINGFQFSHFPGEAWMYENADRTGNADQLTVTTWADMILTGVEIPAAPNNAEGTVYLFVKTENNEWSLPYEFTLGTPAPAPAAAATTPAGVRRSRPAYPKRVMIDGRRYQVRSLYEERDLLRKIKAEAERTLQKASQKKAQKITYTLKRTDNRIKKIDNSEGYRQLRRKWDEELLTILASGI